jgi:transposase
MAVSRNIKEEAFALYCAGVSYDKISKTLKVGSASIPRWKDKYDWEARKRSLMSVIEENDKSDKEKINEKMLESIKRVWARQVEQGLAKASARDVIEVVKVERLVSGLSTENVDVSGSVDGKYELKLVYPDNYERKVKKKKSWKHVNAQVGGEPSCLNSC